MPDFASRRLARTSCVLLPMEETMPIPVTTTRLMTYLPRLQWSDRARPARRLRSGRRLQRRNVAEQADLEIERAVDNRSVRRQPAVGYAQDQLRAHDPLDVD